MLELPEKEASNIEDPVQLQQGRGVGHPLYPVLEEG